MKCQEIRELLSPYYDKMLGEAERIQVEVHLKECEECRQELEDIRAIADLVRESGEYLAPGDFSQQVMERIAALPQTEAEEPGASDEPGGNGNPGGLNKAGWKKPGVWLRLGTVAAILVLAVVAGIGTLIPKTFLTGNSPMSMEPSVKPQVADKELAYSSGIADTAIDGAAQGVGVAPDLPERASQSTSQEAADGLMAPKAKGMTDANIDNRTFEANNRTFAASDQTSEASNHSKAGAQDKRKVIKTGRLQVEVTDVDKTYKELVKLVEGMQGYVENSSFQNSPQGTPVDQQFRSGSLTLRVPVSRFEELNQKVDTLGRVVSSQLGGQDVSAQYYDTQARLNNWRQQESQLGQVLKQAKTIKDILLVQEQMQRVRQEIEVMEGTLKNLGELSDMATLTVELTQVKSGQVISITQQGLWARAREQFITSINNLLEAGGNLFIWLVGALPGLVILLLPVGAGYWYFRIHKK